MGKLKNAILFVLLFWGSSIVLHSQINGTNLLEYQYGKIPDDTSKFSSLYDRAVVNYSYKRFKAGLTLEQFYTKYNERNYIKPTQYSLQYVSDPLEIKIGSFYETLGRGLLLRSFEIPGAILEDLSYRSRNYFHRDILGFSSKFSQKNFSAKILYGKPLDNLFPPSQPENTRRTDIITALYSDYTIGKQTIGAAVMNNKNNSSNITYGMVTASGTVSPSLSYYTELAKNLSDFSVTDFSENSSYALYSGINFSAGNLGISAEYKNYKNFLIGAGINEPPALVKEHSYKVLNRSTHVLQPINETGYQLEVFYTFPDFSTLTINNTIAINDLNEKYVFQEYFAAYDFTIFQKHDIKLFADFAEDPFKEEMHRISSGVYADWKTVGVSTIKTDYEFQTFIRSGTRVYNHVLSLGYAYKSKISISLITEISNDPFITDKKIQTWYGTNLKYQINNKNNIQIFAGQRRGGPACNAGVCYEVLDFSGIELRLNSRF
jgi:hypothetical protein